MTSETGLVGRMVERIWGTLSKDEIYQLTRLSAALFLIIKSYWVLKIIRDTMFETMIGLDKLPTARILSVFINLPMVLSYGKLVDLFSRKEYVLYLLFGVYGALYALIGLSTLFIEIDDVSEENRPFEGKAIGWLTFFSVETFGSISIAGFWAYTAGCVGASTAVRIFPFINIFAQFGSIFGPLVTGFCIREFGYQRGVLFCFLYCALGLSLACIGIYQFAQTTTVSPSSKKKSSTSLSGGLKLVLSDSYIRGILCVSTIYHVISTILDYQMKRLAKIEIPDSAERTEFMATFGFCINVWSFTFALLGTSFLFRRFGLKLALVGYPVLVICVLVWVLIEQTLASLFIALVLLKGLSYALNNPAKESLFVKLTDDVRYKAKSWIDMCGQRVAKGFAASITKLYFLQDLDSLLLGGTLISIGFAVFWVGAAFNTGKKYEESGDTVQLETISEKEE